MNPANKRKFSVIVVGTGLAGGANGARILSILDGMGIAHDFVRGARESRTCTTIIDGRRGDIIKVLWFDGQGLCLFAKRLERGRFVWPQATQGAVSLTPAQLSMLLEGIDWRAPQRTWQPSVAG